MRGRAPEGGIAPPAQERAYGLGHSYWDGVQTCCRSPIILSSSYRWTALLLRITAPTLGMGARAGLEPANTGMFRPASRRYSSSHMWQLESRRTPRGTRGPLPSPAPTTNHQP